MHFNAVFVYTVLLFLLCWKYFTWGYPQDFPVTTLWLVFNKCHWCHHHRRERARLAGWPLKGVTDNSRCLARRCLSDLAETKFSYPFWNVFFMSTGISCILWKMKQHAMFWSKVRFAGLIPNCNYGLLWCFQCWCYWDLTCEFWTIISQKSFS